MSFSSSSDNSSIPGLSIKKFVTQDEIDEKKRKRQEEWDKVRKPEDPEECPEEPTDNRCLFDRLEEQRLKKQEEFEEQIAFRNQVKRLDEDEVEFLDFVSERQQDLSREKKKEEAEIISEMKSAQVVKLTETKPEEKKIKPAQQTATKRSQSALLSGAVRRKGSEEASTSKKAKLSSTEAQSSQDLQREETSTSSDTPKLDSMNSEGTTENRSDGDTSGPPVTNGAAKVIAILPSVLPGMNQYEDSSDSVSSSSDSEPDFAVGGRGYVFVNKIQQSR